MPAPTPKEAAFLIHFPCETCGGDPQLLIQTLRVGEYSELVTICDRGFELLKAMMSEKGYDCRFVIAQ